MDATLSRAQMVGQGLSILVRSMNTMTASSHRDRPLSSALSASALPASSGPSAAETVRFPTAVAYAAALEAQAVAAANGRPGTRGIDDAPGSLRELRILLEENLTALRAVYEDQRLTIASAVRNVETVREELRLLGQPEAPWIQALDQTRSLIRAAFADIATQHATAAHHRR
jgi:hypothetical protein